MKNCVTFIQFALFDKKETFHNFFYKTFKLCVVTVAYLVKITLIMCIFS